MRFRPEDQYCKPSIARSNKTSNLVLKVKRRRTKAKIEESVAADPGKEVGEKGKEGDEEAMQVDKGEEETAQDEGNGGQREYEYSVELLGVVNTTYQFSGMCYMCMPVVFIYKPLTL